MTVQHAHTHANCCAATTTAVRWRLAVEEGPLQQQENCCRCYFTLPPAVLLQETRLKLGTMTSAFSCQRRTTKSRIKSQKPVSGHFFEYWHSLHTLLIQCKFCIIQIYSSNNKCSDCLSPGPKIWKAWSTLLDSSIWLWFCMFGITSILY